MVFERMKNVSPIKEKFKLHWRIIGCFFIVVITFFVSKTFFKEVDSHLISLITFVIYSAIIYKFFGGYTQHYKND